MSRDLILTLLHKGSTGNEILQILDAIVSGVESDTDPIYGGEPTADPIQF
jgi:hypothetical protein